MGAFNMNRVLVGSAMPYGHDKILTHRDMIIRWRFGFAELAKCSVHLTEI